jgi:Transcriptional regulator containing GAF, AAA-type ATPase, and DNA binding domains
MAKAKDKSRKSRFTEEQVIDALEKSAGIYAGAAKLLGVDRSTIKRFVDKHKAVREALPNIIEFNLDAAEMGLMHLIGKKNFLAIKFILETRGKGRGYGKVQEIAIPDGVTLKLPDVQIIPVNTVKGRKKHECDDKKANNPKSQKRLVQGVS